MTDRTTWLIYARTGREFTVADDLRLMGAEVWCGRVLEGQLDRHRGGRKRVTVWTERPALPNYLFADLTPHQYQLVKLAAERNRDLRGFISLVEPPAMRGVQQFIREVERAYSEARKAKEGGDMAPPTFRAQQVLEAVGGPLAGIMGRYRAIIEEADGYAIEIDADIGRVRLNPADVRAAE